MPYEPLLDLKVNTLTSEKSINDYKSILKSEWNNNIYYSYEYLIYYENEHQKLRCFLLEQNGKPVIVMPFFVRRIPNNCDKNTEYFDVITPYGYGGPLYSLEYKRYLNVFWKKIDEWYKKNNIISEFVRFSLTGNQEHYTGDLKHSLNNVKGKILPDQGEQWKNFSAKVRNNYRKAEKSGLRFFNISGKKIIESDIIDFYDIYIETMKRNKAHKSYFFKLEYFKNLIFKNINNFEIAFVLKDGIRVSTELLIYWKDTAYAFLGGTKKDFFEYRPNDFLRVEVIKLVRKRKMSFYKLGGGVVDGDGLYHNKKALFPKDENFIFYTGRKILNKSVYDELTKQNNSLCSNTNSSFFPTYREPV